MRAITQYFFLTFLLKPISSKETFLKPVAELINKIRYSKRDAGIDLLRRRKYYFKIQ